MWFKLSKGFGSQTLGSLRPKWANLARAALGLVALAGCQIEIINVQKQVKGVFAPEATTVTIVGSAYTNSTSLSLSFGSVLGNYASYCILENDTTVGNCSWTAGTLPSSFTVTAANGAKVLTVWLKDSAGRVGNSVNSGSVILDTVTPTLASATVTNTSPSNSQVFNLTYGSTTDTYSHYCILVNDTTVGNCAWTSGTLPTTHTVTSPYAAKVLSVWIRDAALNTSARVDTNSVTLIGFASTGALATARKGGTMNALATGKILIAGGAGTLTAELYDPVAGTFAATDSSKFAHVGHSAVRIGNGQVLLIGGGNEKVEAYDPSSAAFSVVSDMSTSRTNAAAVVLSNGTVLVTGGSGSADAEIYTPWTDTWAPTSGAMLQTRDRHTATLLPNGKVLIAGGTSASAVAEIYNPATGTFSAGPSLAISRADHSAILLSSGLVWLAGGDIGQTMTSSDYYSYLTGTVTAGPALLYPRKRHQVLQLKTGRVFVAGGVDGASAPIASTEYYDVDQNSGAGGVVASAGPMLAAREGLAMESIYNGKVVVAGGYDGTSALSSAELFDPYDSFPNTWTATGAMNSARTYSASVVLPNGKVLVAGGRDAAGLRWDTEIYDPRTGVFTATGSLTTARLWPTLHVLSNGKVGIFGGGDIPLTGQTSIELYDPSTGVWSVSSASLTVGHYAHASVTLTYGAHAGKVLIAGGTTSPGNYGATADLYDPVTDTVVAAGAMTSARYIFSMHTVPYGANGGKVVALGGASGAATYPGAPDLFDPTAATFSAGANAMVTPRSRYVSAMVPWGANAGKIMIMGGYNGAALSSVEFYDPIATTFAAGTAAPVAHSAGGRAIETANGFIISPTSYTGTVYTTNTDRLNPSTLATANAVSLASGRGYYNIARMPNGGILMCGGTNGTYQTSCLIYK